MTIFKKYTYAQSATKCMRNRLRCVVNVLLYIWYMYNIYVCEQTIKFRALIMLQTKEAVGHFISKTVVLIAISMRIADLAPVY